MIAPPFLAASGLWLQVRSCNLLLVLRIAIAIASFSFFAKRLIYINHTDLTGKDSPLKYLFTCVGVGLAVGFTLAHILEYTLRVEGPQPHFSSALFHVHYCMQVSTRLSHAQ